MKPFSVLLCAISSSAPTRSRSAGKLKVFNSLSNFYSELRAYRRDKDGKVVKERDHLMDAMRYLVMSGRGRMVAKPQTQEEKDYGHHYSGQRETAWMM